MPETITLAPIEAEEDIEARRRRLMRQYQYGFMSTVLSGQQEDTSAARYGPNYVNPISVRGELDMPMYKIKNPIPNYNPFSAENVTKKQQAPLTQMTQTQQAILAQRNLQNKKLLNPFYR